MGKNIINIIGKHRWDQGHFIHEVKDDRGFLIRQVVLAPTEILARQWAQEALDAGFKVAASQYGTDGLWCFERI